MPAGRGHWSSTPRSTPKSAATGWSKPSGAIESDEAGNGIEASGDELNKDLDSAVERTPLEGHDGKSGATLERVRLADGTRLVVKRFVPATDLTMRLTGDLTGREYELWSAGVLDRLPPGVGHAIVDAWRDGDTTVLVMADVGDAIIGWGRELSRAECRRILAGAVAVHDAFRGETVPGLVPLAVRVSMFSPARMAPEAADDANPLPGLILRGWERFAELVPPDVAAAVFAVFDDPARLAGPLARAGTTLIHGDLWVVNVGLERHRVVLLDWGLATDGSPAFEFASFLAGCASRVRASREEIIDDFRQLCAAHHDDDALRLGLFGGLVELGWNKALDVAENPDPAVRARERADLDWWVGRARAALDAGLLG